MRPFHAQVAFEEFERLRIKREESLPIAFSLDEYLALSQTNVFEFEAQGFARTQTIKEHQGNKAQIAKGSQTAPELRDFLCGQRDHNAPGNFHPKPAKHPAKPSVAEGRGYYVTRPGAVFWPGNLTPVVEAVYGAGHTDAVVYRLGRGFGLMVQLEANILRQMGMG
jgi:hypothetical protein